MTTYAKAQYLRALNELEQALIAGKFREAKTLVVRLQIIYLWGKGGRR